MNKQEIIKDLNELNDFKMIKINKTDKERLVFNSNRTFDIFKDALEPFNDYTYDWLNSFLNHVIELLGYEDFNDIDELRDKISDIMPEWVDSEVDVYTNDLTEWLSDRASNIYYMNDSLEEFGYNKDTNILMIAQYKAIDEVFSSALNSLIKYLEDNE